MKHKCIECNKIHEPTRKGYCVTCYNRNRYRALPVKEKKRRIKKIYEWEKANRDKRNKIVARWRKKTGQSPPEELKKLWRANKRLEKALAIANKLKGVSSPSKSGSNNGTQ